ncbi:zinc-ribbon and DUF3426 domain-containing protein [Aquabacterium sp.]|uniref:zinc-ribbon and DUF3426 domain-containing protein n=1 Tax=Aquabacterium sp. TaxID=1872578 RepID=UPI003783F176
MSLATRCTECGTVFRVVQDQLKVSEGWVRCGRCSAVFNALENLCDIDAVVSSPGALEGPAVPAASSPDPDNFEPAFVDPGVPEHEPVFEAPAIAATEAEPEPAAAGASTMPFDEGPAAIVDFGAGVPAEAAAPAAADSAPAPAPQFVRAAERDAFWRRPALRATLVGITALLGALLAAQLAMANRDLLAAHLPATRPALSALCQPLGCRIQALRRIDRLSVDSSGLARVEGAALYKLSVVLHNRAETPLQSPALDLSLTDAAGKLIARRVLQGTDLGLPPVMEAGQELPLQALLSTGDKRVTGYTVELFYP